MGSRKTAGPEGTGVGRAAVAGVPTVPTRRRVNRRVNHAARTIRRRRGRSREDRQGRRVGKARRRTWLFASETGPVVLCSGNGPWTLARRVFKRLPRVRPPHDPLTTIYFRPPRVTHTVVSSFLSSPRLVPFIKKRRLCLYAYVYSRPHTHTHTCILFELPWRRPSVRSRPPRGQVDGGRRRRRRPFIDLRDACVYALRIELLVLRPLRRRRRRRRLFYCSRF